MSKTLLAEYKTACHYPGRLDEAAVDAALREYVKALGIKREVRRLPRGWTPESEPALLQHAMEILEEAGTRAALDARDARDARAALDARDARDAIDAIDARAALRRWCAWCFNGWFWSWDLSWISCTHIGAVQLKKSLPWAEHVYRAYIAGAWMLFWTDTTLYWVAKPTVRLDDQRRLHCEDGPACANDLEPLYFIDGQLVDEQIVLRPETLTVKQIKSESNAEVRRIMRERFGEGRYLRETGAQLIHADYEVAKIGAAPRALMEDSEGQRFLVGTDGSTGRCYYMRVPATVNTCREAHIALCGFDETRIKVKG